MNHSSPSIVALLLVSAASAAAAAAHPIAPLSPAYAAAQCPGLEDPFEDNDDCASAVPIPMGLTQGLYTETPVGDQDFFSVQVPPNSVMTIEALFSHAQGDINVFVTTAGCTTPVAFGFSTTDNESMEVINGGSAPMDLTINVFVQSLTETDCNVYDLLVSVDSDPCDGAMDDNLENNDDCSEPVILTPGPYPGLMVFQQDPDFFRVTVPAGEELQVQCDHLHDEGNVDLYLYDPAVDCGGGLGGSPLARSISLTDGEALSWTNTGSAPLAVILEVSLSTVSAAGCNAYELEISTAGDPCALPDDPLEDNDTCGTAIPLAPGVYTDLYVGATDPDFYTVQVDPGDVLEVDMTYTWADGALALILWDPDVACGTGPFTDEIDLSLTPIDNERLFWLNDTGVAREVIVEVSTAADGLGRCNRYDLEINAFPDPCPGGLGEIFCTGVTNSTGTVSNLCAAGSQLVADNSITLTVTDLPQNSMGYFLVAREPAISIVNPPGSVGELCVASLDIGRQAPILSSGATGSVELLLDLTQTPQPDGSVAIAPGETWCWQFWHRDQSSSGPPTSNLSSARCVLFE